MIERYAAGLRSAPNSGSMLEDNKTRVNKRTIWICLKVVASYRFNNKVISSDEVGNIIREETEYLSRGTPILSIASRRPNAFEAIEIASSEFFEFGRYILLYPDRRILKCLVVGSMEPIFTP